MKTLLGLGIISLLLLNACSSGKSTTTYTEPTVAAGTSTPTNQTPFDSSLNSGLFDSRTGSDPVPTVTPQAVPYKESDLACLNNGLGRVYAQSGYQAFSNEVSPSAYTAPGVTTIPAGCLVPQAPSFGQDLFLDEALLSMGGMRSCFNFVASRPPAANATPEQLLAHFEGAKRALVRCYRRILARQAEIAQWSNPAMQRFDQVDSHLYLMLSLLSQQ